MSATSNDFRAPRARRRMCVLASFGLLFVGELLRAATPESLQVQWRDSCDERSEQTYFAVELQSTGEIVYVGYGGVREIGHRQDTISRWKAQALLRDGRRILAGDVKDRMEYRDHMAAEPPSHSECLFLKLTRSDGVNSGFVLFESRAGIQFENGFARAIDVKKWICPARTDVPRQQQYCGQPLLLYSHIERESCESAHVTQIFPNGLLHYYVSSISPGDKYEHLDLKVVKALREFAFQLPNEEVLMPPPNRRQLVPSPGNREAGQPMRWLGLEGQAASRFREELENVSATQWSSPPTSSACSDDRRNFPIGTLSIER